MTFPTDVLSLGNKNEQSSLLFLSLLPSTRNAVHRSIDYAIIRCAFPTWCAVHRCTIFWVCLSGIQNPNKTLCVCIQRTKRPAINCNCLNSVCAYLYAEKLRSSFSARTYVRRTRRIFWNEILSISFLEYAIVNDRMFSLSTSRSSSLNFLTKKTARAVQCF